MTGLQGTGMKPHIRYLYRSDAVDVVAGSPGAPSNLDQDAAVATANRRGQPRPTRAELCVPLAPTTDHRLPGRCLRQKAGLAIASKRSSPN